MRPDKAFKAIVIGASAGGIKAISAIISKLPDDFKLPIIIALHMCEDESDGVGKVFGHKTGISVVDASDKMPIEKNNIYVSPPGYHLAVEPDRTFSLSLEPRINYSRPSIDVLLSSASEAYSDQLVGVILTGANSDGSSGLLNIKQRGGFTIVQDPKDAYQAEMPQSALDKIGLVDEVLQLEKIGQYLCGLEYEEN